MTDWSNEWATPKAGFYVRDRRSGIYLAGGWTDDAGRRRPLIAGTQHSAKRFGDRAGAEAAVTYLMGPCREPWHGDWEVVEHPAE
ncbi:MAG: hypothetical protein ACRD2C_10210 [Acidimicrobiales bacterium]